MRNFIIILVLLPIILIGCGDNRDRQGSATIDLSPKKQVNSQAEVTVDAKASKKIYTTIWKYDSRNESCVVIGQTAKVVYFDRTTIVQFLDGDTAIISCGVNEELKSFYFNVPPGRRVQISGDFDLKSRTFTDLNPDRVTVEIL